MALKFRRGTTAQQSGSLAFGEPYVNTTLGTLLVGGQNGDIVLATSGTGSTGNFGAISGSGLDITGDANIGGNLTLGGNITIGNQTTDVVNVVANLSSSLIPSETNVFDLGSNTKIWRDLYISTGSIKFVDGTTVVKELTLATITGLESATGSNNVAITNINAFTSSQETKDSTLANYTGSVDSRLGQIETASGSAIGRINNLESTSASVNVSVSNINSFTASQETKDSTLATYTGSVDSRLGQIETASGSAIGRLNNLESTSASLLIETANLELFTSSQETKNSTLGTYTASVETRLGTLGSLSGSFARIDSANTFNGNQIISGALTVTQDFVVLGSSSIQHISSSTLDVGTNIITVAVNQPSLRFGGLSVIDSGSAGASGSLLYDSVQDEFIFVHKGDGTNITSSHLLVGPETYNDLGNESYIPQHKVIKSSGKEHIVVSNIYDDGTTISLGSNIEVTGSIVVSGNVDGVDVSVLNSNINSFSSSALTRLSALETETSNLESFTSSINTTIKNRLNAETVISGSSQVTGITNGQLVNSAITIAGTSVSLGSSITLATITAGSGIVSGSSQLTNDFDSRYLNTGGDSVVSGSSQISHDSTTGYSANRHVDHTAVSITAGSGLTGGGDISATRTISVATGGVTNDMLAGSIANSKLTNSTISGISLGSNLATLTIGTGLSGTSYNGSGAVTIANTGVLSNVAGTGVSVSGATGNVTISIGQAVATSSDVRFNSIGVGMAASTTAGRIDAAGDVVAFSTSDIRFKENIKAIENPIQKIRQISGNTYDWKAELKDVHGFEGNDVGVIAQEIEAVLPQLVTTRENGYKAVKYDKLVALLIEGMKEQQLQIEQLRIDLNNCKTNKGL